MAKIRPSPHDPRPGNLRSLAAAGHNALTTLVLSALLLGPCDAEPLLLPGSAALRSDLQLLADAGVIGMPLSAWPVSRSALARQLQRQSSPAGWHGYLQDAWARVAAQLGAAPRQTLGLSALTDAVTIRRFDDSPRAAGLSGSLHRRVGALSINLRAAINDAATGTREELDGSYIGLQSRRWLFSAGAVPRWWGPGHEGSMILSTAARPVPALALDTLQPFRFQTRGLRWLGSINVSAFVGALEQSRHVPDAKLLGARLTLKPLPSLEIGLSRTAQWGGRGRPEDLESLIDLVLGRDNRGDSGITLAREPGNQLGGIDLRWGPVGGLPAALYTQWIGEDEAGGLPSRLIALAGAEYWHAAAGGYLRWHAEVAASTVEFYKSRSRVNLAYEHGIYRDGYRYRSNTIGHAMDNDGLLLAFGVLHRMRLRDWQAVVRRIDINRDGTDATGAHSVSADGQDRWELLLRSRTGLGHGELDWGVTVAYVNPRRAPTDIDTRAYARWQRSF